MSKPVAAVILALIGLTLQVIALIFELFLVFFFSVFTIRTFGPFIIARSLTLLVFGIVVIMVGISGICFMSKGFRNDVFIGSILEIVASIFAYPTLFGFFIGSFLMFVAGILGFFWIPIKGT